MVDRDDRLDVEQLAREAREWVSRMTSGDATADDTVAMMRWRALSPDHAEALGEAVRLRRRVAAAGEVLRADPATRGLVSSDPMVRPSRRSAPRIGRRAFLGGAVAASAGAVMLVRPPLDLWPSLADLRADYHTATGERRMIAVAQGLSVELNTRTSLNRRNGDDSYRFALIRGEVAVDATHPARAAAITTDAGEARTGAGRFTMRLEDGSACVTCYAGDVAVIDAANRQTRLLPGQRIVIGGASPGTVAPVDLAVAGAWRRGELIFNDRPLVEVVAEINRYRPGRIILADSALGRIPINAVFRLDRIDRAVSQIREVANASVMALPGGVVVLS